MPNEWLSRFEHSCDLECDISASFSWIQVCCTKAKKTNKQTNKQKLHNKTNLILVDLKKSPHNLKSSTVLSKKIVLVYFAIMIVFFSSESLNERLLYHSRLQACCSRTYCHTKKKPFTTSQPDCNRLRAKRRFFPFHIGKLEGYCSTCDSERWIP